MLMFGSGTPELSLTVPETGFCAKSNKGRPVRNSSRKNVLFAVPSKIAAIRNGLFCGIILTIVFYKQLVENSTVLSLKQKWCVHEKVRGEKIDKMGLFFEK